MKNYAKNFMAIFCFASILVQAAAVFAEVNVAQTIEGFLKGTVTLEEVRALPVQEQDVLTALQAAIGSDKEKTAEFVKRAVQLLPSSAAVFVTAAITASPEAIAQIVAAAVSAAPAMAEAIVTAAITMAPDQAPAVVTAAIGALPEAAAAIVQAALNVAPDQAVGITAAALDAAPGQADAINAVVADFNDGQPTPPDAGQTSGSSDEGVPVQERNPSPTQP